MTRVENKSPDTTSGMRLPPGVLCAKCEHLNPPGSNVCEFCQAKLYRTCSKCGNQVQEAYSHCVHCGTRDHRHLGHPHRRINLGGPNNLRYACGAVLIIMLAVLYKVFQKIGNMNFGQ